MRSAPATLPDRGPHERQYRKVYGAWRHYPFKAVALGGILVERWVHYCIVKERNVPCIDLPDCTYCQRHQRRTYKAYIPAIRIDTNEICVAEFTEHAMNDWKRQQPLPTDWRGWAFTLIRLKKHANAPVHVQGIRKVGNPSILPPAFDALHHLHRLWGWVENNAEEIELRKAERDAILQAGSEKGLAEGELPC